MNRILFVDDEPGVLDGLRNALRCERKRWDMVFTTSGAEALAAAEAAPFDLVLTDMRMPGIDGAELLSRIRATEPSTARLMLSGQADAAEILRALPLTHRFLAKPCEPRVIRDAIERGCSVNRFLPRGRVRRAIGGIDRLNASPEGYARLLSVLENPATSAAEIAEQVERDPAIAAKILQLVNSSFFGSGKPTSSVRAATLFLGAPTLRGLLESGGILPLPERGPTGVRLDQIAAHSRRVADLMRRWFAGTDVEHEAHALGLLHDVGKIALAQSFPRDWPELFALANARRQPIHLAERELFGVSHAEAGACLLGLWGLSETIVDIVAFHHRPSAAVGHHRLLAALHLADTMVADEREDGVTDSIDAMFLAAAVPSDTLDGWRSIASEQMRGVGP